MKSLRFVFTLALAVIFVVTTLVAVFGAGKVIDQGLRVLLKLYPCDYQLVAEPVRVEKEKTDLVCKPNGQYIKENLIQGLSMFLVGLPVAFISFKQTKKSLKSRER